MNMTSRTADRTRSAACTLWRLLRVATTAALAALLTFSSAGAASAADLAATGSPYGYGNGYKNVLQGKDAFQRLFKVGGSEIPVYSTSFRGSVPTDPQMRFQAVTRAQSNLGNVAKAADVAARSSSIGSPLADPNSEAVAVQLAIWRLVENTDIKPVGQINAPILQRAEELVESASTVNTPERASSVRIDLRYEKTADGGRAQVTLSAAGKALAGEYVTVKAGRTSLRLLTNDAGVALARLPKFSKTTTVKASFTWSLPAGSVLVPATGASVITARAASVTSTASSKVAVKRSTNLAPVAPKPKVSVSATPSASPSASAEPTPTPSESTAVLEDPAADVIELTPEAPVITQDEEGLPGWLPLVGVIALFFVALGIARQRLNGE